MRRTWPWLLLAAMLLLLVSMAAWWVADSRDRSTQIEPQRPSDAASKRARTSASRSAVSSTIEAGGADALRSVAGQVLAGEGFELELGRIDLRCADDPERRARVQLDADGSFVGEACERSTCVRLTHPQLVQHEAWVIPAGEVSTMGVDTARIIDGRVEDAAGGVIANAEVLLSTADGRRLAARSDTDGDFAFAVPKLRPCDPCDEVRGPPHCSLTAAGSASSARLLASAQGHASVEVELPASSTEVTLSLPAPAPALEGRVVGMGGQAFTSRLQVLATNMDREQERHAALVDARGHFRFESLAQARYRVRALRDGLELARAQGLSPGEFVELRAEREARGRQLELRLVDESDAPVSAAQVDGGPFRSLRSDVSGRVAAQEVLPGNYVLRVRAGNCPAARVELQLPAFGSDSDPELHVVELRLDTDCKVSTRDL